MFKSLPSHRIYLYLTFSIEIQVNAICGLYSQGIYSLIIEEGPKDNDNYIILMINCHSDFYKKHCKESEGVKKKFRGFGMPKELYTVENYDLSVGMDDKKELTEEEMIKDIQQKHEMTLKYERIVEEYFEIFDPTVEELIQRILFKHKEMRMEKLKKKDLELYNKQKNIYESYYSVNKDGLGYYYLNFDDFILIFCRTIKYYLGLDVKIDFSDNPNQFMLSIYGSEEKIKKLAEKNKYQLRLKPYAMKYDRYLKAKNTTERAKTISSFLRGNTKNEGLIEEVGINNIIIDNDNDNDNYNDKFKNLGFIRALKYDELDPDEVLHWSPYQEFESSYEVKFQRYENNDDFHECNLDPNKEENCNNCNLFRNIDKLRIIYDSVDKMIKRNYLVQEKILDCIILKRNHVDYAPKLTFTYILKDAWWIFNSRKQMEHIFFIRNFYGETVAYYFLWLRSLIQWLLIPGIVGLVFSITTSILDESKSDKKEIYKSYVLLLFSIFVILWSAMFNNHWGQKEQLYNYLWGTEDYKKLELDSENFVPDGKTELIFGVEFPYVKKVNRIFKYCVGYLALISMLILTVSLVLLIFWGKKKLLKIIENKYYGDNYDDLSEEEQKENDNIVYILQTCVSMGAASVNAIQIKVMNYLYSFISRKLNDWENHQKDFQSTNSLAIKLFLFDFVNCYTSIYYIGFLKGFKIFEDTCVGDEKGNGPKCIEEIGVQLYTTFVINLIFNIMEIGLPIYNIFQRKREIENAQQEEIKAGLIESSTMSNENHKEIVFHSLEHQLICDKYDDLISEYSEMIIQIGYVCLFSVAAPYTPLLIFFLVYIEKFVDTCKMFFLVQMQISDQSTGIEIYKKLITGIIYIGMLTNTGIIMVNGFQEDKIEDNTIDKENTLLKKLMIYLGMQAGIFALTFMIQWNIFPGWFKYLNEIKDLYYKKFYRVDSNNLPHINLIKKTLSKKKVITENEF